MGLEAYLSTFPHQISHHVYTEIFCQSLEQVFTFPQDFLSFSLEDIFFILHVVFSSRTLSPFWTYTFMPPRTGSLNVPSWPHVIIIKIGHNLNLLQACRYRQTPLLYWNLHHLSIKIEDWRFCHPLFWIMFYVASTMQILRRSGNTPLHVILFKFLVFYQKTSGLVPVVRSVRVNVEEKKRDEWKTTCRVWIHASYSSLYGSDTHMDPLLPTLFNTLMVKH